jgi:hypothetical protein
VNARKNCQADDGGSIASVHNELEQCKMKLIRDTIKLFTIKFKYAFESIPDRHDEDETTSKSISWTLGSRWSDIFL